MSDSIENKVTSETPEVDLALEATDATSFEPAVESEAADVAEQEAAGVAEFGQEAVYAAETEVEAAATTEVADAAEFESDVASEFLAVAANEPEAGADETTDATEPVADAAAEPEVDAAADGATYIADADADTAAGDTADAANPDAPADPDAAVDPDLDSAVPGEEDLQAELQRERTRNNFFRTLRSTIFSLIVVAAVAVIIAMLVLPVMQIQGTSMTDTLQDQDIVVALRGSKYETGDVIAFYYNNNILIKRVIAGTGQWVNITDDGTVYVDNVRLDEPYITDKSLGDCNIQLPYQVPDGKIFVMGDHRSTSLDSRNTALGCVSTDMVVGRLLLRAWPPQTFGPIR